LKAIVPIIFLSLISLTSPSQAGILDWLSEIFAEPPLKHTSGGAHSEKTAGDLHDRSGRTPPPPPPPSNLQGIQPIVTPAGDAPAQLERPTIPSRSSIAPILKSGSARTQLVAPVTPSPSPAQKLKLAPKLQLRHAPSRMRTPEVVSPVPTTKLRNHSTQKLLIAPKRQGASEPSSKTPAQKMEKDKRIIRNINKIKEGTPPRLIP